MGPLLETKIHVPRERPSLVARPRLSDRLSRATGATLVLVSAPAGFGKTTLLTQWLQSATPARAVAWLSLDPRDNDPAVFARYLVAALERSVPGVGAVGLSLLETPQSSLEGVLGALLNDLHAMARELVLVLDDFHVIDSPEIRNGIAFLLEHLPDHVQLVLAGRVDPGLPLARMRGNGELVEIRAADLRFTSAEVASYLRQATAPALTGADIIALEVRTEGWIAALQLAVLSLQGRQDAAAFIADFAGDDRYIVDYLVEEVLARQPDDVRAFLLATSVLGRLTGALCEAVTGLPGGRASLEALERANLFVVPLDDRRSWYRYHHLFADVLHARLLDEEPARVRDLHRRASDWWEVQGDRAEAIRHALAAQDVERAADLVELAIPATRQTRQEATLLGWLEALPDEAIRARPVLTVGYASALMSRGETAGVEERLEQAERWLDATAADGAAGTLPAGMVVADHLAFARLPSAIALYRAGRAHALGDVTGTMCSARRALELAHDDDHVGRGASAALLGLAYWATGELPTAHRSWSESMVSFERAGHRSDVIAGCGAVADIRIAQGRLREAMSSYERGLQLATVDGGPPLRGAADMFVGMSQVLRERDDPDAAVQHLLAARELGERAGLPQNAHRWCIAMAGVRWTMGDLDGALALLDDAARLYVADFFPDVRPIWALRARVLLAQGRYDDALTSTREHGISATDDLSFLLEYAHITLAAALLAQGAAERSQGPLCEADQLLDRLLRAATQGERAGSIVEILVLKALVRQARGERDEALSVLDRALVAAEPEGYVRLFADHGAPLSAMLSAAARRPGSPAHLRRVLASTSRPARAKPSRQGLVDPLSPRELDVLQLLGSDLDGPGIARALVVSVNTARTHIKSIYAKLGVTSRQQRCAEPGSSTSSAEANRRRGQPAWAATLTHQDHHMW
ncbi:LuxR C-terminal-related transcriptional regulator [Pengzhenrongella frigida]|uniref:LuxR C-terminal-related transcriptional regulator n=1 Tax=Pengzhenrongella frigida TaxID=1259133 RepID=UPI001A931BF9|nr:LuxR C-terminal-related transcriptional regulator [Cellulomonas sp. HLT2-17]